MPEVYAASVNPPRRAKRALPAETNDDQPVASVTTATTTTTTPSSPRTLLPMRPYAPRSAASGPEPTEAPPPPAKRGRKPGPLSRTAREAQRRLNHSIIEKARRTKINDALAALKQLVPANYGKAAEPTQDQLDEEDDNDDDYEEGKATKPQPAAGKGKGKKEEKEKEFKLEILIRTVSFLQDLLQRVDVLESAAAAAPPEQAQSAPVAAAPAPPSQIMNCPSCNAPLNAPRRRLQGKKRKRAPVGRQSDGYSSDDDDRDDRAADDGGVDVFSPPRPLSSTAPPPARRAKIARRSTVPGPSPTSAHGTITIAPQAMGAPPAEPRGYTGTATPRPRDGSGTPAAVSARLPPISAWLECVLDPQLPGAPSRSPPSEARRPSASPHLGAISNGTSKENNGSNGAYLPSPPNSTRFAPERTTQAHPPFLSLGPVATAALVGPPPPAVSTSVAGSNSNHTATSTSARTPEDETAASLLLQIASSPPFRAVRSASFSSAASASSVGAPPTPTRPALNGGSGPGAARAGGKWPLSDPSGFSLQGGSAAQGYSRGGGGGGGVQAPPQVQTPSSLLGLDLGAVGGPLLRY